MNIPEISWVAEEPSRTCRQEKNDGKYWEILRCFAHFSPFPTQCSASNWEETSEVLGPPLRDKGKSRICVQHSDFSLVAA